MVVVQARQAGNRFLNFLKGFLIRALHMVDIAGGEQHDCTSSFCIYTLPQPKCSLNPYNQIHTICTSKNAKSANYFTKKFAIF